MENASLSEAIFWMNMLMSEIELAPIVKDCIFEYGCEHHVKKLINSLMEEAENKSSLENDAIVQRTQTTDKILNQCNYSDFNYPEQEQATGFNFYEDNYSKISHSYFNSKEYGARLKKIDDSGEGEVDVDMVWQTEKPVMFGFSPVAERRSSMAKADISFNDEEFTLGSEIKQMVKTLVD